MLPGIPVPIDGEGIDGGAYGPPAQTGSVGTLMHSRSAGPVDMGSGPDPGGDA